MPDRLVVSDTSPLLYLHQVGHLDLLRSLYGRVSIPPARREGLLPSLSPVMEALRQTTMYLTQELIETALRDAGERRN